jgi:spermidine synthase
MRRLDGAVFLSGAALMGLEIVGSRVLAPVFGTSIFVWGALITTFLASLAVGYELGGRLADRRPEPEALLDVLGRVPLPDRFRALAASLVLFGPPSVLMGMVTPFAVRLAARDLATVGSAAGRLSAVSTAGSILGTFTTAFLLIPAFPTRPILFGLGLALVVAGFLLPGARVGRRFLGSGALVAAGAAVFLLGPVAAPPPGPIGLLALLFPGRPVHTAVAIGLGAGMVPSLLSRHAAEIATTSIELDPEVVSVAGRYFGFLPDANDRVLVGDGRRELDRQVEVSDVIFLDAYFADSLPFHLVTREFFELCTRKLAPDGVIGINFGGNLTGRRNALFWAAVKTLRTVFPRVYVFSAELASGRPTFDANAIVVASLSKDRLDKGTIADRAEALAARFERPPIRAWAGYLYDGEMRTQDVPVLTDAYGPTDALQHLVR